ncbi:C40 family peptidase [Paenibacillus sp. HN-1]|uniref:C40 family peptidase n=1 Tax=Paenibacillus TaxID=44249 RepID=UPI001CA90AB8|nr:MULTISPECIES: C40 family peptidase [Paenibacillus]MBY9077043.1 C40 family peptidase [Paenibacillus sp. CGMCC 1.18879]MBY9086584.1 C40 family peptidase [Paenibacillus sinensis]
MNKRSKQLFAALFFSAALFTAASPVGTGSAQAASASASSLTGVIESTVRLRSEPSVSKGTVLGYLRKGDSVAILEKSNSYFYKVRTADGDIGYVSSQDQYISVSRTSPPAPAPSQEPPASSTIETVIARGMSYLGTPYEYGSSRSDTSTFDCSDFVRQAYLEGANIKLPADSRQQGAWVRSNSTAVTDVSKLKRGDLMFFMSYRGSSASAYAGIDKSAQTITHVAIYLGDGQILHTYSASSGGVRVDQLSASWMNRFMFGGSVIR